MKRSKIEIPVSERYCLTVEEAAAYSLIGQDKLRQIIADDTQNDSGERALDFVLYVGKTIRIKRPQFEKYLENVSFL